MCIRDSYSPALTDFIIQTKGAQMFITGPSVIKQVTGEIVTPDQLGGPAAQMSYSGVVHFIAENDEEAAFICRRLLAFLPSNNLEDPPRLPYDQALEADPAAVSYTHLDVYKRQSSTRAAPYTRPPRCAGIC